MYLLIYGVIISSITRILFHNFYRFYTFNGYLGIQIEKEKFHNTLFKIKYIMFRIIFSAIIVQMFFFFFKLQKLLLLY